MRFLCLVLFVLDLCFIRLLFGFYLGFHFGFDFVFDVGSYSGFMLGSFGFCLGLSLVSIVGCYVAFMFWPLFWVRFGVLCGFHFGFSLCSAWILCLGSLRVLLGLFLGY